MINSKTITIVIQELYFILNSCIVFMERNFYSSPGGRMSLHAHEMLEDAIKRKVVIFTQIHVD